MNEEQLLHGISKGLEVWTLTNLTDLAIILSFLALALLLGRGYLRELEEHLSLRVSLELWRLLLDFGVDLALFAAVVIGFLVTNPDIFADVKIPIPFLPAATLCLAVALVFRVFYQGRRAGTSAFAASLALLVLAVLLNGLGYTLVMEAATQEWLAEHPSAFWSALQNLRSNQNPELSMQVFWIFAPGLYGVLFWAITVGITRALAAARKVEP